MNSGALEVSVIVPTYNRLDTLPEVLNALLDQEGVAASEIIVVNDGSEQATRDFLDSWSQECAVRAGQKGWSLRVIHQGNQGPAAARNAGVQAASGRLVAFLGDDTVPCKGWLATHLVSHAKSAQAGKDPEKLGVIGYTGWHPRMRLNPFLRYINENGLQFGYALIDDPESVPFNFFYTSNLSVPRQALLDEPFDVDFPYAAWEDIEVSYRLKQRGFGLIYACEATVAHDHPTNLQRFSDRQEKAGFCGVVFFRKHPELGGFLGLGPEGPPPIPESKRFSKVWWLVQILQGILESRWWRWAPFGWSHTVPKSFSQLWEEALRYHYIQGLHRGWRDEGMTSRSDF